MNPERAELERLIVEKAKNIYIDLETNCFNEKELEAYLEVWYQLAQYFRRSDDTEMSVVAVREYLQSMDHFFQISNYPDVDETCRDRAHEALQELDASMKYIIEAVGNKISRPGE